MADYLFISADALSSLVDFVGSFVALGVGVGCVCWILGYVIYWVIDVLRY